MPDRADQGGTVESYSAPDFVLGAEFFRKCKKMYFGGNHHYAVYGLE